MTRQRRHPSSVNHNDDLVQETFSKLRISTVQREKREVFFFIYYYLYGLKWIVAFENN